MTPAPFHQGLGPHRVIEVATELTRESHLMAWSIRDLARRLGVTGSVIYHHVGGRDLISRRVVERVLAGFSPPPPDLPWQDWFTTLLASLYPPVTEHPGVAKWLLLHGPIFPTVVPTIDAGVAALERSGVEHPGLTYAVLLNNAMATISLADERLLHGEDGPRDHATLIAEFRASADASPGLTRILADSAAMADPRSTDAKRLRRHYYDLVVASTIAGLDRVITGTAHPDPLSRGPGKADRP